MSLETLTLVLVLLQIAQPHEPTGCGSNIVSATVVATLCGHREGDAEMLDLLILWRGRPGWFQHRGSGSSGSRGSAVSPMGGGLGGQVTQYTTYDDITIGFAGDFAARTATIEQTLVRLEEVNAVLVDGVDDPAARHIAGRRRLSPRLPLGGDLNASAIRRSDALVAFLQCEIPMPVPRSSRGQPVQQPPVITVCEKMRAR